MDEFKSVLHEIIEHLHHLTPQIRADLHNSLDHAGEQDTPAEDVDTPPAE